MPRDVTLILHRTWPLWHRHARTPAGRDGKHVGRGKGCIQIGMATVRAARGTPHQGARWNEACSRPKDPGGLLADFLVPEVSKPRTRQVAEIGEVQIRLGRPRSY